MLETIYFYSAAIGGLFLLVQLVLMLLGGSDGTFGDADLDLDIDVGADGMHSDQSGWHLLEMISLRTVAAAATFFGLFGLLGNSYHFNSTTSLSMAVVAGLAAMYSVYWLFKQLAKVESAGNTDINNALGEPAQVYVTIVPQRLGKIHLVLQGRTVEYQAVTDDDTPLPTGSSVRVIDVVNGDTVKVTRLT